jgi:hypothetical protein
MTISKIMGETADNLINAVASLDGTGKSGFILGSIKSAKSILGIRDKIYLSKFQKFWTAPEENGIEMEDFVRKTQEQEDWQKVGENFLLIIDSFSAFDKCYFYGKIWVSWLKKEINTNEFIEMTEVLQNIFITDLQHILYHSKDYGFSYKNEDRLYNSGFLQRKRMDPSLRMRQGGASLGSIFGDDAGRDIKNAKAVNEKLIRHMENPYTITQIGKKLIEILTKK